MESGLGTVASVLSHVRWRSPKSSQEVRVQGKKKRGLRFEFYPFFRTQTNATVVKAHHHLSQPSVTLNLVPAGVTGNHGQSVRISAVETFELVNAIISVKTIAYQRVKVGHF